MKHKKISDSTFIIRLDTGEEIIASLLKFFDDHDLKSGSFTGLGAITRVELRYFFQHKKQYHDKIIEKEMEVVSLIGNINTMEEKSYLHSHVVCSDENMQCYGGHLKSAVVGPTMEIVVEVGKESIGRQFSKEIGLNLLDI
jgi:uncharacterized protein